MQVVSLFSGAGGMDLGFLQADHDIIWANDNWEDAIETYRHNINDNIVLSGIKKIKGQIPQCDIVIGGFPCQGFSVANMKRSKHDERNKLYLEFVDVLKRVEPPLFLAENVKGILSLDDGNVFEMIVNDFSKLGYNVKHAVLNAADYGVPQKRERVFLLGINDKYNIDIQFPPSKTHTQPDNNDLFGNKKEWKTIGEALKNIPEPEDEHNLKNHVYSKFKIKWNGYIGHRKVSTNEPCPTITGRGDKKGGVVIHPHPNCKRRLSVREAAIVQSFPIDFEFKGSKTSGYRQIANAVPPKLAYSIAKELPQKII